MIVIPKERKPGRAGKARAWKHGRYAKPPVARHGSLKDDCAPVLLRKVSSYHSVSSAAESDVSASVSGRSFV